VDWIETLGIQIPIVQAPIGNACTPELVSKVSEAGALGMFAGSWRSPREVRELIRETKRLTSRPFGVNLTLAWPEAQHEILTVCMAEEVRVVSLWWGDMVPFIERLDGSGIVTMATVGTSAEARHAEQIGADVIVAQGSEAGGHVWGNVATMPLVAAVAQSVATPVIAAGGIGDGRGIAAALCLGASGVWMGTRFIATQESGAHPEYKQAIVEAAESETVRSDIFDLGWPGVLHRTLRNRTVEMAHTADGARPGASDIVGYTDAGVPVRRYDDNEPLEGWEGSIGEMCLYAGESCSVVHDIPSVTTLIPGLWSSAQEIVHAAAAAFDRPLDVK
jgi:nitronate monooxygenase